MVEISRQGTVARPSSFAAATRPWPARMVFDSSISTGLVKPKVRMLSAIWRTCFFEWVRALPGQGLRVSGARCFSASSGSAEGEGGTREVLHCVAHASHGLHLVVPLCRGLVNGQIRSVADPGPNAPSAHIRAAACPARLQPVPADRPVPGSRRSLHAGARGPCYRFIEFPVPDSGIHAGKLL